MIGHCVYCRRWHFGGTCPQVRLAELAADAVNALAGIGQALALSRIPTSGDSDNRTSGSEHSRTDGEVPQAPDAALERQRPRRDKSPGHGQSVQEAERPEVGTTRHCTCAEPDCSPELCPVHCAPSVMADRLRDNNDDAAACYVEALAARLAHVSARTQAREATADSAYAAGMLLGWNLCTAGASEEFNRIRERRMRDAAAAALAAPESAQTPAGINAPEDLTVTGMDPRPAQTPAGERERFERWAAALDEPRYENGDYKNDHVQTQWEAWQAALFAGDRS